MCVCVCVAVCVCHSHSVYPCYSLSLSSLFVGVSLCPYLYLSSCVFSAARCLLVSVSQVSLPLCGHPFSPCLFLSFWQSFSVACFSVSLWLLFSGLCGSLFFRFGLAPHFYSQSQAGDSLVQSRRWFSAAGHCNWHACFQSRQTTVVDDDFASSQSIKPSGSDVVTWYTCFSAVNSFSFLFFSSFFFFLLWRSGPFITIQIVSDD